MGTITAVVRRASFCLYVTLPVFGNSRMSITKFAGAHRSASAGPVHHRNRGADPAALYVADHRDGLRPGRRHQRHHSGWCDRRSDSLTVRLVAYAVERQAALAGTQRAGVIVIATLGFLRPQGSSNDL